MTEILLYTAGLIAAAAYVGTWVHALKGTAMSGAGQRILERSPRDLPFGGATAHR